MAKRLTEAQWRDVWRNVGEIMEQEEQDGFDPSEHTVMAVWLDPQGPDESVWGIVSGSELLEDGFKTEQEAEDRLKQVENIF